MTKLHVLVGAALLAACVGSQSCQAAIVTSLSDNFDADTHALNWTGDSVFKSIGTFFLDESSQQDSSSTDLIGTIPTIFMVPCVKVMETVSISMGRQALAMIQLDGWIPWTRSRQALTS